MLVSNIIPPVVSASAPAILQFPTDATRAVRSLRNMTTQLLQEAAQVIPNQQLLINVVSRRVRQLGLGHRPLVEATPRSSLTDIALQGDHRRQAYLRVGPGEARCRRRRA